MERIIKITGKGQSLQNPTRYFNMRMATNHQDFAAVAFYQAQWAKPAKALDLRNKAEAHYAAARTYLGLKERKGDLCEGLQ